MQQKMDQFKTSFKNVELETLYQQSGSEGNDEDDVEARISKYTLFFPSDKLSNNKLSEEKLKSNDYIID